MNQLTEQDRKAIREEVAREFPTDPMMQELHEIRLARYYEVKDLPLDQQLRHYLRAKPNARAAR